MNACAFLSTLCSVVTRSCLSGCAVLALSGLVMATASLAAATQESAPIPVLVPKPAGYDIPIVVGVAPVRSSPRGLVYRYTVDGTDPTATSWGFEGGILVTDPTEVRIRAFVPGQTPGTVTVGKYQVNFPLTTRRPVYEIQPQANGQALVTLTCPTVDASIVFTIDGSEPTYGSRLYRQPLVIPQSQVASLRARAIGGRIPYQIGRFTYWVPALVPSGVAFPPLAPSTVVVPQLSLAAGRYQTIQAVSATCVTAQAVIRYTSDGSDPTEAAAIFPASLVIDHNLTLKARGFKAGFSPSPIASAVYELQVPSPTLTPAPGVYANEQAVVISTSTASDLIRVTLDGTDPTEGTPVISGPLSITASKTVTARAYRTGWSPSASVVGAYTLTVATPTLTPGAGYLTGSTQVFPVSITTQAVFRYTLDGQVPTESSPLVPDVGIPVNATAVITVVGFRAGFTPSAPVAATYHLPYVTWAQRTLAGAEGTPTVVATAHLSEPLPQPYTVAVISAAYSGDGSANEVMDYQIPAAGLIFPAGAVDATIAIGITDDAIFEATEQATLVLEPSPGALVAPDQATCVLTIADNDPRPAVAFVSASQMCSESDGPVALPIHLVGTSSLPSMVTMTATGGSAHAGIQYIFEPTTIAFASFQSAAEAYVTILNTAQAKEDLTVVFALTGADGQPIGNPSTCTLQIRSVVPGNPIVTWNNRARAAVARTNTDPAMAARVYALVGVAQRRAVLALPPAGISPQGAVLGASLEVLSRLFPSQSADFLAMAQNDLQSDGWGGLAHEAAAEADSFGRQIGSLVVTEATSDGSAAIWLGAPPVGPPYWFASWPYPQPPLRPLWGQVRPWFLAAGNEFRPAAPPAFGSAAYLQALTEVRTISDRRTAEQLALAGKWADGPGSPTPAGTWMRIADDLMLDRHLSVVEAAKLSGLLGATLMDASIACWDAKYTYWLIRPYQADRSIITPIGQPNFPSYVSGHATFSGAASEILAHAFPDVADAMRASAEEAALSRLYGGIHYRFDNEQGLALGRQIAVKALAADATGIWGSDQSPRIAFVSPAPAAILTIRQPTIDVKIADDHAIPVAGIQVSLTRDGSAGVLPVTTTVTLAADGLTGHVLIQPTADLPDGLYVISVTCTDSDGHSATGRLFFGVDPTGAPVVTITSPVEGDLVGMTNPVHLTGRVSKLVPVLTLNSTEIPLAADGSFQLDLPIDPFTAIRRPLTMMGGINELYVRAIDAAGLTGGARVTLRVDDHAPTLAVEFPADNAVVAGSSTAVIGRAQDLVLGQVTTDKITVKVNGILATIRNGNFQIAALPLVDGVNVLTVVATDQSGNQSTLVSHVVRQQPTGNTLALVSGDAQEGAPYTVAAQNLSVRALSSNGAPIPHQPVTWNVSRGDGRLVESTIDDHRTIVTLTGADGIASINWELGGNAGVGNQRVTATAPGVQIPVIFTASVTPSAPIGLFIVDGDQQFGFIRQPLYRSLVVVARDRTGNPVPGAAIDVSMLRGTGTLAGSLTDTPTNSLALVTDVDGFVHVTLRPGSELGPETNAVRFTVHGATPELSQTLVASVIQGSGHAEDTGIAGVVLSTEHQPIAGVTMVIEGTTIGAVSDALGHFAIRGAPAGHRHLQVMGTTGNHDAVQYPTIGFEVDLLSGGLIHMPMPIYLPTMDRSNEVLAGGDQEVTITIPGSTGAQVVIAPHSTIRADGVRGPVWMFTSPVNAMAIPMPAPGGSAPILVQTLQPSGTRLDPPAKVRWPNTFGLLPGAQVELISFDHDLGQFVGQGTMSVEEDGQYVKSDAGTGLTKAGWNLPAAPPVPEATVTVETIPSITIEGPSSIVTGGATKNYKVTYSPGLTGNIELNFPKANFSDVAGIWWWGSSFCLKPQASGSWGNLDLSLSDKTVVIPASSSGGSFEFKLESGNTPTSLNISATGFWKKGNVYIGSNKLSVAFDAPLISIKTDKPKDDSNSGSVSVGIYDKSTNEIINRSVVVLVTSVTLLNGTELKAQAGSSLSESIRLMKYVSFDNDLQNKGFILLKGDNVAAEDFFYDRNLIKSLSFTAYDLMTSLKLSTIP